ncbi:hypothetical protein QCA50_020496 [Cerrena zonata]|uniref:Uncharacterized protein n=1 Tax=Cerrena zonata TaxID=2478898 RepID=A0AAW0FH30_9APHY
MVGGLLTAKAGSISPGVIQSYACWKVSSINSGEWYEVFKETSLTEAGPTAGLMGLKMSDLFSGVKIFKLEDLLENSDQTPFEREEDEKPLTNLGNLNMVWGS